MKICSRCHYEKSLESFYVDHNPYRSHGRSPWCRGCYADYKAERTKAGSCSWGSCPEPLADADACYCAAHVEKRRLRSAAARAARKAITAEGT